ncbi:MAG: NUMOD3 domain-containing DNA-binding protein [Candidatus Nanopelagicus sp.]
MNIYYLYIKTHKKSRLKYFGYTKQNPYTYAGSGTDWKTHLKNYGHSVETEVILQTTDKSEIIYWGSFYSTKWNIVSAQDDFGNKIWANKIPETGSGAGRKFGTTLSEKSKKLISDKSIGRIMSDDTINKIKLKLKGREPWNKGKSGYKLPQCANKGEHNPMYGKPVPKKECPYCNKSIDIRNFARSHGERCKLCP